MDTIKDGTKSITYEDFERFGPCWLTDEYKRAEHAEQLARYRAMRDKWTALDILRLDEVSADDRLWLVLREELVDAPILHEFACRCAERALSCVHNPDPRSISAIEAKRKWLRGECTDDELYAAWSTARLAAHSVSRSADSTATSSSMYAVRSAAACAAWSAERSSSMYAVRSAAAYAAEAAAAAADAAAMAAAGVAGTDAAWVAEHNWQAAELIKMLEEDAQ